MVERELPTNFGLDPLQRFPRNLRLRTDEDGRRTDNGRLRHARQSQAELKDKLKKDARLDTNW